MKLEYDINKFLHERRLFGDLWDNVNRGAQTIKISSRLSDGTIVTPSGFSGLPYLVPKGMSGGKIAAIVAGVGLLGAGAYAALRPKSPFPARSWTDRIEQERQAPGVKML